MLPHWDYYLSLEQNIIKCGHYIYFSKENFSTHSNELSKIIVLACAEADETAKELCQLINPTLTPRSIPEYKKIITSVFPLIGETEVLMPNYNLTFFPWKQWDSTNLNSPTSAPSWWKSFTNLKHSREKNLHLATLEDALNALSGLLVLLNYLYFKDNNKTPQTIGIQSYPKLLYPKDYQNTGWESGGLAYSLAHPKI